eukprot:TRINITY_DN1540_c0_g1_i1.p1 TRINITY_DN1540_c0_g1~~TRINITY_DN1540_c0_g1_i1.p1  ORF type:complete len:638 (+),score=103.28 TRINITY_DN1540_c0_g1_i1:50-1963(+)
MQHHINAMMVAGILILLMLPSADAAGGKSIFMLGDEVDHSAIDMMIMYFIVFAVTITLEYTVDTLSEKVTSESGRAVMHHVTEEVMILGGISAILAIFENLGGGTLIDAALFHYVHFVIFVMAIFFIVLVSVLFFGVERSWQSYTNFESKLLGIENDVTIHTGERGAPVRQTQITNLVQKTTDGGKMYASICLFRSNTPSVFREVLFSRYMKKQQRKLLLTFLDLTGLTWFNLALLVGFQAFVTHTTAKNTENDLAIIALWVIFIGFGPLVVIVLTFYKIRKEFRVFAFAVETMKRENVTLFPWHQKKHFWCGNPKVIIVLIQTLLLYQVFYLATVTANFIHRLWMVKGGLILIAICFLPSIVVFLGLLPLVMPPLTILSSVNEYLCVDTIIGIAQSEKQSGRERRLRIRDSKITAICPAIAEDVRETLEHNIMKADKLVAPKQAKKTKGGYSQLDDEQEMTPTLNDNNKNCFECGAEATVQCELCGPLCHTCDINYHRLRLMKYHIRNPVGYNPDDKVDSDSSPEKQPKEKRKEKKEKKEKKNKKDKTEKKSKKEKGEKKSKKDKTEKKSKKEKEQEKEKDEDSPQLVPASSPIPAPAPVQASKKTGSTQRPKRRKPSLPSVVPGSNPGVFDSMSI